MRNETRPTQHGFTFLEVMMASVILTMVVLGGIVVARSATTVTQANVAEGAAETRALAAFAQVRQYLRSAGRSTLQAVPPGETAPGPMQEGVPYDNVWFRQAFSVGVDGPVYQPPVGEEPLRFLLQPRADGSSMMELVLVVAGDARVVCGSLRDVTFVRQGGRVSMRVATESRQGHAVKDYSVTRSVMLRIP